MGAIVALLMALPLMLFGSIITGGTYINIPTPGEILNEANSIYGYFVYELPALLNELIGELFL